MLIRQDLSDLVIEAIKANNGQATNVLIAQYIWAKFETELRHSGDLFYTWQYDVRWVITKLRKSGILKNMKNENGRTSLIGFCDGVL